MWRTCVSRELAALFTFGVVVFCGSKVLTANGQSTCPAFGKCLRRANSFFFFSIISSRYSPQRLQLQQRAATCLRQLPEKDAAGRARPCRAEFRFYRTRPLRTLRVSEDYFLECFLGWIFKKGFLIIYWFDVSLFKQVTISVLYTNNSSINFFSASALRCGYCGKTLATMPSFTKHVKTQHLQPPSLEVCTICSATFPDKKKLRDHVTQDHPTVNKCRYCGFVYRYSGNLARHEASCSMRGEFVIYF